MKEIIKTKNAPAPIGPYNQAIKAGNTLYISGQIPLIPSTMELLKGTIQEETELVMESLKSILKEAGMSFENVVKTTIFIDNMNNFQDVNEVYGKYFKDESAPARETVAVKTLPKSVRIEISMVAVV
ncbi:MAG: RidA family protein [Flavobacteriaceae bacterium]